MRSRYSKKIASPSDRTWNWLSAALTLPPETRRKRSACSAICITVCRSVQKPPPRSRNCRSWHPLPIFLRPPSPSARREPTFLLMQKSFPKPLTPTATCCVMPLPQISRCSNSPWPRLCTIPAMTAMRSSCYTVQITSPEIAAERLYDLGEMQRAANDDDAFLRTVAEIRQPAPTSPWLEQALLYVGNIYLLRHDYDKAIEAYREIEQRFPSGPRAPYSHWKAAWLSLRQGRTADAKILFEQQIALYPDSNEVPAALYWRARLAEEDGDSAMASAFYRKITDRFRNYYYGPLARERASKLKLASDPVDKSPPNNDRTNNDPPRYAILDRVPPLSTAPITDAAAPEDNLRVQKAKLLENGGLLDFAVRELKAAAEDKKGSWLPAETARMYIDVGRYDIAVETLKRAVPSYFAVDVSALPRSYWEALFPKPYWTDLKKFSSDNALDPYMVASLIRQESEFNPNAVSNKNALGLMQLLPRVGKGVAKQEKLKHFSAQLLFTPAINLQLGTRYFRSMVDQFGGFEYALAAYNAGDDRVKDWQAAGKYRDIQEFVESIPFTETREYVQAIMRNANVYRQLYGTP